MLRLRAQGDPELRPAEGIADECLIPAAGEVPGEMSIFLINIPFSGGEST
jgi:hypothetical protein